MSDARFTVGGIESAGPELFGLWSPAPESLHFGAGQEAAEETRWRVSLPDDALAAAEALDARTAALRETVAGLEQADARIHRVSNGVSFAAPEGTAEQRLRESMLALAQAESAVAFGLLDRLRLPPQWSESVAEFNGFLDRVRNLVGPTVEVESSMGTRLVAVTSVGIDGDQKSIWHVSDAGALHRHALLLALETRRMLLALLARTVGGAAILAGRFSVPGGAIAALPATYRFIRDVIDDFRRLSES